MNIPDLVNGCFELFGAVSICSNIFQIRKDKVVKGVDPKVTVFFTSWGVWNLFYYYNLEQYLSWYGGMAIVLTNAVWLWHVCYYKAKQKGSV